MISDRIPPLVDMQNFLLSEFARLMEYPSIARHERELAEMDRRATGYILQAFDRLGWEFECGQTFSTARMASTLGVTRRHHLLLERFLMMLCEDSILDRSDSLWKVTSRPSLLSRVGVHADPEFESDPESVLLDRCGSALSDVLQGKIDPLHLLFPGGNSDTIGKVYRDCPVLKEMNILIQKLLLLVLLRPQSTEGLRVLEIGAGTGSTASFLLPHLFPDRTRYSFTDVSPDLLREAQEKFEGYPFVEYRVLNIEREPQKQGFDGCPYGFTVATNVFHATRDLAETLRNVRQLMTPGGLLVLIEMTAPTRWMDLVFGMTPGWWRFTDTDLRPDYPLLPAENWIELLNREGFKEAFFISPDDLVTRGMRRGRRKVLPFCLIVARKTMGPLSLH